MDQWLSLNVIPQVQPLLVLLIAGGFGTRLGNSCTSGYAIFWYCALVNSLNSRNHNIHEYDGLNGLYHPSCCRTVNMKSLLFVLIAGLLFGTGLYLLQRLNPDEVLSFLDVCGDWVPALALVMKGH